MHGIVEAVKCSDTVHLGYSAWLSCNVNWAQVWLHWHDSPFKNKNSASTMFAPRPSTNSLVPKTRCRYSADPSAAVWRSATVPLKARAADWSRWNFGFSGGLFPASKTLSCLAAVHFFQIDNGWLSTDFCLAWASCDGSRFAKFRCFMEPTWKAELKTKCQDYVKHRWPWAEAEAMSSCMHPAV